ncbi:MAG: maturation protein [Sanya fiers-like virus 15]|nr:MAG: maturation protein [Sanya fiers-like virus 15]UUW21273.1 MAG: maturation protein [Sanya fiers-like virus 15]UUW21276.1 MAG: maturation protein [Sanya fiers-like virus 15]UUW21279.1 MAG: maturation protein [Sanya fiers-like virus 15]UUW21282.1 MAG: maturation protein [Sanya fiers-like virus 15]
MKEMHIMYPKGTINNAVFALDLVPLVQSRSPRVNGRIVFRQNAFKFQVNRDYGNTIRFNDPYGNPATETSLKYNCTWANYSWRAWDYLDNNVNSLQNEALDKLRKKIASVRTNLLDMYRTRNQSISMIRKRMMTLTNAYRALRRGDWRHFKRLLKINPKRPNKGWDNIPGLWLEYWYGWAPFIKDCYNICKDILRVPHMVTSTRVLKKFSVNTSKVYNDYYTKGTIYQRSDFFVLTTARAHCRVNNQAISAMAQTGILNPSLVLWEAVPYSFVVDWFIPVGEYLESLNSLAGIEVKDISATTTVVDNCEVWSGNFKQELWHQKPISFTSYWNSKAKERKVYASFPSPIRMDTIKGPLDLSLQRFSYALSLMQQAFSRKSAKRLNGVMT